MSKGFYQYAREKIKIKKEKELILESGAQINKKQKKIKFLKLMKINITNSQLRFF
jgi:hypothetical protein